MQVLEARHLSKRFGSGRKTVEAVRDVSLRIGAGEVLAFLGPNGAGKTTSIKMIAGLIRPDRGEVRVAGKDPHHDASATREIGAVLEGNRNVYWRLTVEENLHYFGVLKGTTQREARTRGEELIKRFKLEGKRRSPVQSLSRGMQQKLAIAVSLIHRPKLLLLDEPTLGLDVEAAEDVKQLVREIALEGQAVLLTTHQLEVAEELSQRVAIIRKGEIVAEEATRELVQRFSGEAYVVEVRGEPSPKQLSALTGLGATLQDGRISFLGRPQDLYRVLAALEPLPLVRVAQDQADLTRVFLKLIREETSETLSR